MGENLTGALNPARIGQWKKSCLPKIFLIGMLVLLLQIPVARIREVIRERQQTRHDAEAEVTAKWGGNQSIVGPAIVIPFTRRWTEPDSEGKAQARSEITHATFLPETLKISGDVRSEVRRRGIYEVPVFRTDLVISGRFSRPVFSDWSVSEEDIHWDRAYLSVAIADAKALIKQPTLTWNLQGVELSPSAGDARENVQGIHARLEGLLSEGGFDFSFPLGLKGSRGIFFAPFGRETEVRLDSDWKAPSFQGAWLPEYQVAEGNGFLATWNVSFLGRNYPQRLRRFSGAVDRAIADSLFGVNFIYPVDAYRMADRSVKYQLLFLTLTFLTLWLFEILRGIRVHPVQYLLVGAAMCLFYLLELSLAEHVGFGPAYTIASLSIIGLITAYSSSALGSAGSATIVGGIVTVLYLYLYTLLRIQDYALLAGSIGLFIFLSITMFLTRNVDWHSLGSRTSTPEEAAG